VAGILNGSQLSEEVRRSIDIVDGWSDEVSKTDEPLTGHLDEGVSAALRLLREVVFDGVGLGEDDARESLRSLRYTLEVLANRPCCSGDGEACPGVDVALMLFEVSVQLMRPRGEQSSPRSIPGDFPSLPCLRGASLRSEREGLRLFRCLESTDRRFQGCHVQVPAGGRRLGFVAG